MKLQNLVIIFIIIIIPIIAISSLYLNLETKTITMQTAYDEKLIEATKEAMEAFEINTVEWSNDYSSLANAKRQNLMSTVNVFTSSLADKMGISGTSKENILTYVPAIVFIMYDGYYIYSPTYVPQTITNDKGVQLFYYENSGSEGSKITASATQNIGGTIFAGEPMYCAKSGEGRNGTFNGNNIYFTTDVTKAEKTYQHVLKTFVPYTSIYNNGESYVINYSLDNFVRIYGKNQSKEGYIVENFGTANTIEIPVNSISGIKVNGFEIFLETLTENIYIKESSTSTAELKTYSYIYNSNNDKRYYDSITGKFFILNNKNEKVYLPDAQIGGTLAEYKKVLVRIDDTNWDYIELYQLINGNNTDWYYIDDNKQYVKYDYQPVIDREKDCSAINYYVETCEFNHWLINSNIDINTLLKKKTEAIITNINNNLNLSISNYSANSNINYKIPELTDKDWEQALSNISMIAFFQGKKIGLKKYNNYAIVTSTENNEFVSEDSLYYIGEAGDNYYHRYYCNKGTPKTLRAYRNTEFRVQKYEENDQIKYYYKHYGSSENVYDYECFDCIVNRNNYTKTTNTSNISYYDRIFYEALGRERYIQISKVVLNINLNQKLTVTFDANEGECSIASKKVTYNSTYGTLPTPTRPDYIFDGWYTEEGVKITNTSIVTITQNHTLYARWRQEMFTVTFDANRGICEETSKQVIGNSPYGTLPIPTRAGYIFDGWYTEINGGIKVTEDSIVVITSDHTLYAHWTPVGIRVGDYVNYIPDTGTYKVAKGTNGTGYDEVQSFTTENLQWRVWSINEETGEIELISATATSSKLWLKGADGYNHGVDILNDLCEALYSNSKGAIARSIKIEDINAKTTYDYTNYCVIQYDDTYSYYGDSFKLTTKKRYPKIYKKEKAGLGGSERINTGKINANGEAEYTMYKGTTSPSSSLTGINTDYYYYPKNYLSNLGINTASIELIIPGGEYWIASRSVQYRYDEDNGKFAMFSIRKAYSNFISSDWLYCSDNDTLDTKNRLRPIVSLNATAKLKIDETKTTDEAIYWNIEY